MNVFQSINKLVFDVERVLCNSLTYAVQGQKSEVPLDPLSMLRVVPAQTTEIPTNKPPIPLPLRCGIKGEG